MPLTVRFFAILREKAGREAHTLAVDAPVTVSEVMKEIQQQFPIVGEYASVTSFAVNGEYAKPDTLLNDGDELALLPPISGG